MEDVKFAQAWPEIEDMDNVEIIENTIVEHDGKLERIRTYSFHTVREMLDAMRKSAKSYVRLIRFTDYKLTIGRYSVTGYIHEN